jgi:energy-coupling factor transporter ATP-binding protein EcfA2
MSLAAVPSIEPAEVPTVTWDQFLAGFRWQQGEHVSLIGSTGKGKTTAAMALLPFRRAVVVWSSKPRDATIDPFTVKSTLTRPARPRAGEYLEIKEWPGPAGAEKLVLRPAPKDLDEARYVRYSQFHACASALMHPKGGNWCVFADDTYYLCEMLKLSDDLSEIWAMGRSHGVSLVSASQRPASIPLLAYNCATHLFLWKETDDRNLDRLAEIGVDNKRALRRRVQMLDAARHEVLYVNTNTGEQLITAPRPQVR